MFATEVGVDDLGEDAPLEELNRSEVGGFYGFPYLHGPDVRIPDLSPSAADVIARTVAPAHTFIVHTTPLGMTFSARPRPTRRLSRHNACGAEGLVESRAEERVRGRVPIYLLRLRRHGGRDRSHHARRNGN